MKAIIDHIWNMSAKDARALQTELRERLICKDDFSNITTVAGIDVSYEKASNLSYAGVVVMTFPELEVVEQKYAVLPTPFPYIPGLLTFREGPSVLAAFEKLSIEPDLLIFDGHGQAHPKGFGIAAHMGLLLDKPAIGCAKKRLCGAYKEPDLKQGSISQLEYKGESIGTVVRTKSNVKAVFISQGHRISLTSAVGFIFDVCRGYRLPEPTRKAHNFVNQVRKSYQPPKITLNL